MKEGPETAPLFIILADVIRRARDDQLQRYGKETEVGFEIIP
jgi:hypothetical protein